MIKFIYYYYYIFYSKKMVQSDPHFETLLALSGSQAFILIALINGLYAYFFCEILRPLFTIGIWGALLALNFYFLPRSKTKKIIQAKPTILNSEQLSVIVALFFLLFSVVCAFLGPILGKKFLEICG